MKLTLHKLGVVFLTSILSLIVGLRGDTLDTAEYLERIVNTIKFPTPLEYYQDFYTEWGFGFISYIYNSLYFNERIVLITISALTFYGVSLVGAKLKLTTFEILPFYLPTFFITQQFVQIRQGLAIPLVLFGLIILLEKKPSIFLFLTFSLAAISFHLASLFTFFVGVITVVIFKFTKNNYKLLLIPFSITLTICLVRFVMSTGLINVIPQIENYSNFLNEWTESRDIFHPSNMRVAALILIFTFFYKKPFDNKYLYLLVLESISLGLRIGFYDFAVLSGRLAVSIGFVEIFLLPMLIKNRFNKKKTRLIISLLYLFTHGLITIIFQYPDFFIDYFRPLNY